jgi:hypothetical protein
VSSGDFGGEIRIDRLIRSKRKTISLEVRPDGSLIVRAPMLTMPGQIEALVKRKQSWIREKRAFVYRRSLEAPAKDFGAGEEFLYLGNSYLLEIVPDQEKPLLLRDKFYLSNLANNAAKQVFEVWYKGRASQVIQERVDMFARKNGFTYKHIRITRAKTRWGSCGAQGSLNFSYRLVMAPLEIIDYVVIHELVHLKVRSHSKTFWSEVEELMPDYRRRIKWLKRNGHLLTLE